MYPVKRRKPKVWKWVTVTALLLLAAVLIGLFGYNRFEVTLNVLGDCYEVLDYGTPYEEAGCELTIRGSRIVTEPVLLEVPVEIEGMVDTSVVGEYTVTYRAEFLWLKLTETRRITVMDRIPPEITLVSDPEHLTVYGEPYAEEGFSAWDDYDGDITDRVEAWEEEGVVHYSVSDSSGNVTELTRQILYFDTFPPVIELAGGEELRLGLGTRYEEPGYTATDSHDGDVTENVQVSGSVDCRNRGSYTLTYRVTDESGNEAVVTRTVIVETAVPPEQIMPEGKVIYLTFDDGPGIYTQQVLDILEKYGVKATFFVLGNNREMMRRITEGGHSIGIHTVSHNYRKIYAGEEAFFRELYQMQDRIYEATGIWTTLLRFPGGSSNTVSSFNKGIMTRLTGLVQEHGFQYFDWNVDSDDAGRAWDSETVFRNVTEGVSARQVSVVLQHDVLDYSVAAVERIIQWGLENGYTFLPLEPSSPGCHHNVNN